MTALSPIPQYWAWLYYVLKKLKEHALRNLDAGVLPLFNKHHLSTHLHENYRSFNGRHLLACTTFQLNQRYDYRYSLSTHFVNC